SARAAHLPRVPAVGEKGRHMAAKIYRRLIGAVIVLIAAGAHPAAAATAAAVRPRGAGPANPFADFGPLTGTAITLDVINTVIVVYYLWRIWSRREGQAAG